jgi:hypothetical protein
MSESRRQGIVKGRTMRRSRLPLIFVTGVAAVLALCVPVSAQNQFGDANAQPAPFNPQMAALMSMIVQPRHAKLGLAGKAQNWPLAKYELIELRRGFVIVSKAVPRWKGLPVPDLVEAAVDDPMKLLEIAVQQQHKAQFDRAFARLTEACNACHSTTDHSYIVIKEPDGSAFPNQQFEPKR